jgi:hypothetical protein
VSVVVATGQAKAKAGARAHGAALLQLENSEMHAQEAVTL